MEIIDVEVLTEKVEVVTTREIVRSKCKVSGCYNCPHLKQRQKTKDRNARIYYCDSSGDEFGEFPDLLDNEQLEATFGEVPEKCPFRGDWEHEETEKEVTTETTEKKLNDCFHCPYLKLGWEFSPCSGKKIYDYECDRYGSDLWALFFGRSSKLLSSREDFEEFVEYQYTEYGRRNHCPLRENKFEKTE